MEGLAWNSGVLSIQHRNSFVCIQPKRCIQTYLRADITLIYSLLFRRYSAGIAIVDRTVFVRFAKHRFKSHAQQSFSLFSHTPVPLPSPLRKPESSSPPLFSLLINVHQLLRRCARVYTHTHSASLCLTISLNGLTLIMHT